jgi:hypothetical protein
MSGTQLVGVLLASVVVLGRLVVRELGTGASQRLSLAIDLPVVFIMAFAIFLAVGH